ALGRDTGGQIAHVVVGHRYSDLVGGPCLSAKKRNRNQGKKEFYHRQWLLRKTVFLPFLLRGSDIFRGNPRRRWIGVLARRIDQHLAASSPPRIVLRNVRRRRRWIDAGGYDAAHDERVAGGLRVKAHRPLNLERITYVDIVVNDDGELAFLVHQRPGTPRDFFHLLGVLLFHRDHQHAAGAAALGE